MPNKKAPLKIVRKICDSIFCKLCLPVPFDKLLIKNIGELITKLPLDYQCLNLYAKILIYSSLKKYKRDESI